MHAVTNLATLHAKHVMIQKKDMDLIETLQQMMKGDNISLAKYQKLLCHKAK